MEKIRIDDFAKIKSLSEVSISPDGKHIAFVVSQPDVKENCYKSFIWIYETETGKCRKLTAGDSDKGLLWLDEERILFPGDRKKAQQTRLRSAGIGCEFVCRGQ